MIEDTGRGPTEPDPARPDDSARPGDDTRPVTRLLVVRHGHAGDREAWEGPDERRPLTKKGRRQAAGLVDLLGGCDARRILSSHYVRCLETVVPLAGELRLGIDVHPALAEGSSTLDLSALVAELAGTTTVLCTHGDVVWNLVVDLAHHPAGAGPDDGDLPMAKGSTWLVEGDRRRLVATRYLPPPTGPA